MKNYSDVNSLKLACWKQVNFSLLICMNDAWTFTIFLFLFLFYNTIKDLLHYEWIIINMGIFLF